jgi:hypothetical protein
MFANLTNAQRNQHVEVCRYFFRANVMKKHLDALVEKYGTADKAAVEEWDEFWAYYSFWLSGLWVACEGIERIRFGDADTIAEAKRGMTLLHPIRQATFHYKPSTAQMMRHFDIHELALTTAWTLHANLLDTIGEFLESLPPEYLQAMDDV